MINLLKKRFNNFIESDKAYPFLAAFTSGIVPMIHYYKTNFWLANSLEQFAYFLIVFLLAPLLIIGVTYYLLKKSKHLIFALLCLNIIILTSLVVYCTLGISIKRFALICFLAPIISFLSQKFYKKILIFELLLAFILFIRFLPYVTDSLSYSNEWANIEDDIEAAQFKKKPNVYVIQPDGYANFSELKKENYNFDNSEFEMFLSSSGFKLYQDFRSNYYSTLSSNASMFSMKHHYYNNPKIYSNELAKSREIIAGENPVVSIFNKNGYKTFLMINHPYFIVNRPKIGYDYCNISFDEVSYVSNGFKMSKNIENEIGTLINGNKSTSNFFFIEQIAPGHIVNSKSKSKGVEGERAKYHTSLKYANDWLKNIISIITKNDDGAIIVIAADHGGFVGMTYIGQSEETGISDTLVKSIFTAALAIKWPDVPPVYDNKLKSSVNLFRILFTYLGEEEKYLEHLEANESYTIIKRGDDFGSYMLIDDSGNVVFEKK